MIAKELLSLVERGHRKGEAVTILTLAKEGKHSIGEFFKIGLTESGELVGEFHDDKVISSVLGLIKKLSLGQERIGIWSITGTDKTVYKVMADILRPKVRMNVFGAGHVGQAVSVMGTMLGYSVRVYDDRYDLLSRERFPDPRIGLVRCSFETLEDVLGELRGSINVIVTRGHQYDEVCLKQVVDSSAAYIGMIGSKRRVLSIFKKLSEDGINECEFRKVHAPIGLRIRAITPQEIAISILAEVIQELNGAKRSSP